VPRIIDIPLDTDGVLLTLLMQYVNGGTIFEQKGLTKKTFSIQGETGKTKRLRKLFLSDT
jgi:hypothetical protein